MGFWDPLGLSADGDVEVFKRRRETELKHGRRLGADIGMCLRDNSSGERSILTI